MVLLPIPIIHNLIYGSFNSSLFVSTEFLFVLLTFLLLKKGRIQTASILLLYSMLLCMAALISFSPMGILNIASLTFPALIVVSSMVFGRKQFILFAIITLITFNVLVLTSGKVILLTHPSLKTPLRHAIDATIILTVTSLASGILAGRMRRLLLNSYKDRADLEKKTKDLELSQQRFKSTIELAVDCILIGDPKGNIIDANSKAEELTGYTNAEILGKHISDLFPESTLKAAPLRFDLLQQGHSITSVRDILRKDGTTIAIEMNSKKMPDGTYQSFIRDITERISAETKLRESEEKYRSMIEQATEGFVLLDENGKIAEWNQGQELITGLPKNYVLGKSFTDVMFDVAMPESKNEENRKLASEMVQNALKSGAAPFFGLPSVTPIIHSDGTIRQMEQIVTPIRTSKGFQLGAICRDITHTVTMEAEIRKHQHLESLGLLAGGIGHD
ncbi:MAG: PAS domain S-box protein, partial [Fibrobacteres bacterium]|nr:PAS domain S-box protein [Fibrobacterota bacterium]